MLNFVSKLSRRIKYTIILFTDLISLVFCFFFALILRLNDPLPFEWFLKSSNVLLLMLACVTIFFFIFRLHLKKISSFNISSSYSVAAMVIIVTLISFILNNYFQLGAPRTVPLITGVLFFIAMIFSRVVANRLIQMLILSSLDRKAVAIYGAGSAGTQLVSTLANSTFYKPVLFIDENPYLQGLDISGLRVYDPSCLKDFVKEGKVEEVLLAMPSLKASLRKRVGKQLEDIDCKVQEVPAYEEIIKSGDLLSSLREINPEELLGRNNVKIELSENSAIYNGANVLVSGAGGSIGSELCRMIVKVNPKRLVIFEMSEFSLYNIEKELKLLTDEQGIELIPVLGSVCDSSLLKNLFKRYEIDVVLHAAAYKHVPLVECNTLEGIKNNVFGTKVIAEAAMNSGVKNFTLISTDKAVRPTSVMGTTKRIAEIILQNLHEERNGECIFSMVRFGNVLGSSGSVIPVFKQQIELGGPVVVTHQDITRYFMTINEAAQLVLVASSYAEGGDVFVLDMGEPVKIIELARSMIELSGFTVRDKDNPDGDIEIKIGELRPGEKLYEELLIDENILKTPHTKIMRAQEGKLSSKKMASALKRLETAITNQDAKVAKEILFEINRDCNNLPIDSRP